MGTMINAMPPCWPGPIRAPRVLFNAAGDAVPEDTGTEGGGMGDATMERDAMAQSNLATATKHPDAFGCNAYCTAEEHCTTVLSCRTTAAAVLADIAPVYCVLGWRVEDVRPCEMTATQWWPTGQERVLAQVGHQLLTARSPVDLDTHTVWRVLLRSLDHDVRGVGRWLSKCSF